MYWLASTVSNLTWHYLTSKWIRGCQQLEACYTAFQGANEWAIEIQHIHHIPNLSARWFPFIFSIFSFVFLYFLGIGQRQLCFLFPKLTWLCRYPCQSFKLPDFAWLPSDLGDFSVSSFASSMWMYQTKIQKVSQSIVLLEPQNFCPGAPPCTAVGEWSLTVWPGHLREPPASGGILGKSTGNYFCRFPFLSIPWDPLNLRLPNSYSQVEYSGERSEKAPGHQSPLDHQPLSPVHHRWRRGETKYSGSRLSRCRNGPWQLGLSRLDPIPDIWSKVAFLSSCLPFLKKSQCEFSLCPKSLFCDIII